MLILEAERLNKQGVGGRNTTLTHPTPTSRRWNRMSKTTLTSLLGVERKHATARTQLWAESNDLSPLSRKGGDTDHMGSSPLFSTCHRTTYTFMVYLQKNRCNKANIVLRKLGTFRSCIQLCINADHSAKTSSQMRLSQNRMQGLATGPSQRCGSGRP